MSSHSSVNLPDTNKETSLFFGPQHLNLSHYIENGFQGEKLTLFACGDTHSSLVTESGKLYILLSSLLPVNGLVPLNCPNGETIRKIICNKEDTLVVTASGSCFCYKSEPNGKYIFQADGENQVIDLAVGNRHNFLLMKDGSVRKFSTCVRPETLTLRSSISQVSCGKEHVLLLTTQRLLMSFGSGSRGQLGHGDLKCCDKPQTVEALEGLDMATVKAGGWHSAALSVSGDLYLWGWNESCQLGVSREEVSCRALPALLAIPDVRFAPEGSEKEPPLLEFLDVGCGSRHTVAIDKLGQIFGFGWNGHKQLGAGVEGSSDVVSHPTLLSSTSRACEVTCTGWTTILKIKAPPD